MGTIRQGVGDAVKTGAVGNMSDPCVTVMPSVPYRFTSFFRSPELPGDVITSIPEPSGFGPALLIVMPCWLQGRRRPIDLMTAAPDGPVAMAPHAARHLSEGLMLHCSRLHPQGEIGATVRRAPGGPRRCGGVYACRQRTRGAAPGRPSSVSG